MGKKLRKQAKKLGFLDYPKTVLYSGSSELVAGFKWGSMTSIPIWAGHLENFINNLDPSSKNDISKPDRNKILFFLAPNLHIYIEIDAKISGFLDIKKNHVQQINIFSRDNKYVNEIAQIINRSYNEGILNEVDWQKVANKFNINQDSEIQVWENLLKQPI
jgi:hypothetical protein